MKRQMPLQIIARAEDLMWNVFGCLGIYLQKTLQVWMWIYCAIKDKAEVVEYNDSVNWLSCCTQKNFSEMCEKCAGFAVNYAEKELVMYLRWLNTARLEAKIKHALLCKHRLLWIIFLFTTLHVVKSIAFFCVTGFVEICSYTILCKKKKNPNLQAHIKFNCVTTASDFPVDFSTCYLEVCFSGNS